MKYKEDQYIEEILEYVKSTYGEHYSTDKHQFMDDVIAANETIAYARWNAIKYLKRYGKKQGHNRKDLLKAIHHILFLLHDNKQREEED